MTVISGGHRTGLQPASRFSLVPAAAGWTVGIIATLSLIASVSQTVRWLIQVPREFVNDYIFNFPDTSFSWAFVLALLAAALAACEADRLVDPACSTWWAPSAGTSAIWSPAVTRWPRTSVRSSAWRSTWPPSPCLVLARNQFWAKVRRGALLKSAVVLVAGMAIGILAAWALLELFLGTLAPEWRLLYARQPGERRSPPFRPRCSRAIRTLPQRAIFGLFGAHGTDGGRGRAVPVATRSQCADRGGRIGDPRSLASCTARTTRWATSPPARDKSVVFAPNGRAAMRLSRGGGRVPGRGRSRRRPRGVAARRSRPGCSCARPTAGRPV